MSEWDTGPQGSNIAAGLALSNEILADEQYMHPSAWVGWQAINEVAGTGDSSDDLWGLAYRDSNNNISYPSRYYVMGNYSKFIRNGYKMIGNSDGSTLTAYNAGSHTLVIVTTNNSGSSETENYDLSQFSGVGGTATPYQTTASENLAQLSDIAISNGTFSVGQQAQSITTFVIRNITYTGTNATISIDDSIQGSGNDQFNYQGSGWGHCTACGSDLYNGSNSWDATAGDSVSMQFTGTHIRRFGVRDTNEGIATVSIDGSSTTEVDFYGSQCEGNQFLWESPGLSSGSHTLTLTVTGHKNPLSSNVWPAIDRVEIDPVPSIANGQYSSSIGIAVWTWKIPAIREAGHSRISGAITAATINAGPSYRSVMATMTSATTPRVWPLMSAVAQPLRVLLSSLMTIRAAPVSNGAFKIPAAITVW